MVILGIASQPSASDLVWGSSKVNQEHPLRGLEALPVTY